MADSEPGLRAVEDGVNNRTHGQDGPDEAKPAERSPVVTSEADGEDADGPASALRLKDGLVVLLAVTTGVGDAVAFLALGRVFSSVITGNLVLLGVGAATHGADVSLRAGLALAGYAAGVLAGAPLAARPGCDHTWPSAVTATLSLEACLLVAAAVVWEATAREGAARIALLLALAAGMGMQSAAVRRLGQMSSTYLTSTFTAWLRASRQGAGRRGCGAASGSSWRRSPGR